MKCNYCGNEIPTNERQCPHCKALVLDFEENALTNTNETHKTETAPPQEKPSNGLTLGIIALLFTYFSPIVSIILACFGLSESKKTQELTKDAKISKAINTIALIIALIIIVTTIIKTISILTYVINGEFV
jgi:hypothetical protein